MCFRPPVASASAICPKCGKKVNEVMGNIPNTCPFCETDISEVVASINKAGDGAPISRPTIASPASMAAKPPKSPSAPITPLDNCK